MSDGLTARVNPAPDPDEKALGRSAGALDALLGRLRQGDRAALAQLYRLTSAKLFGVCLRICGERQAAEDVLHEVYLTIWKRGGTYERAKGSAIAWLSAIARNRSIDWRRAQHPERLAALDAAFELPDPDPLAPTVIEERERDHGLRACLDELESDQSGAIRLAFFGGRTYSEVAQATSTPLATTKSRIRRGLAKLKDCLDS